MNRPKFETWKSRDGWRWRLIAGNGQIVAIGEAHTRERDALRAIKTVRKLASAADIPGKKYPVGKIDLSGLAAYVPRAN